MNSEIKSASKRIAKVKPIYKSLMVEHPFFTSCLYEGEDIRDEKVFKKAVKDICKEIDGCKTPFEIMKMVTPKYREFWLGMCKSYMTARDFSKCAGEIGVRKVQWLKNAVKEELMTKEEYAVWSDLPQEVELYGRDAWYSNFDKAKRTSNGKRIFKAVVPKNKVLCYYNRRGEDEFVVDVSYIEPVDTHRKRKFRF